MRSASTVPAPRPEQTVIPFRNGKGRRAALAGGEEVSADLVVPEDADPMLVATQRQLLANQVSENRAKLAALARQEAQKEAEHQTIAATIHKLDALLPVTQQRVEIR